MVRDLEAAGDLLADSDLVAAIAGDPEAQQLVSAAPDAGRAAADRRPRGRLLGPRRRLLPAQRDRRPCSPGRSLVIHGPPGTGKSQTIANLIAAMVARGRKVLFVAEKRAAIDAVLSRLVGVGLGDLVLDIHEGTRDRQRIAAGLGATLDLAEHATAPDTTALHRRLTDRQQRLRRHAAALHRVHEPWRLSAYQVQSALLGVPARRGSPPGCPLPNRSPPELAEAIRDELREFTRLGGFTLHPGSTPWFGATLRTRAEAHEAVELAGTLSARTLPRLAARLAAACRETGLPAAPVSVIRNVRGLLASSTSSTRRISPAVASASGARCARRRRRSGPPLAGVRRTGRRAAAAVGLPGAGPRVAGMPNSSWPRWRRSHRRPGSARTRRRRRPRWRRTRKPRGGCPGCTSWPAASAPSASPSCSTRSARTRSTPDVLVAAFDYAWYRTILDHIRIPDPDYDAEYGVALDEIAEDFRARDTEHLAANRARVRSAWARQLRETSTSIRCRPG